jgi:hypothetical protein
MAVIQPPGGPFHQNDRPADSIRRDYNGIPIAACAFITVGWSPDIDIGIMDNDTAWQDPPPLPKWRGSSISPCKNKQTMPNKTIPRTDGFRDPILCDTVHHLASYRDEFGACLPRGQQRTLRDQNEQGPIDYRVIAVPSQLRWKMQ